MKILTLDNELKKVLEQFADCVLKDTVRNVCNLVNKNTSDEEKTILIEKIIKEITILAE